MTVIRDGKLDQKHRRIVSKKAAKLERRERVPHNLLRLDSILPCAKEFKGPHHRDFNLIQGMEI